MREPQQTVIRIRGVTYPSMKAAAAALGVNKSTIWRALEKGTLETCGLNMCAGTVDGIWYPSKSAAARAHGVNEFTFIGRVNSGKVNWVSEWQ